MLTKPIAVKHSFMAINLRSFEPGDGEFSYAVYASTRADEMALVDWNADQKTTFLRMQFNAQKIHYERYYPQAEYKIIQRAEQPIGRMIIDRSKNPILLIDIALIPEFRNQGIGTGLIMDLINEAALLRQSVILHVELFNPGLKLYERLGFIKTSEHGIYYEMTWTPPAEAE